VSYLHPHVAAVTSRQPRPRQIFCASEGMIRVDPALQTAECVSCSVRHRVLPTTGRLIRHVAPPAALTQQVWDTTTKRYI
jgi:hypothetical protein